MLLALWVAYSCEPPHATGNIAALNANLVMLAQQCGVKYIENPKSFFLSNGDINDGYYYDNVHLTIKGSNKLAHSLGLVSRRSDSEDKCSINASQSSPKSWSHGDSSNSHGFIRQSNRRRGRKGPGRPRTAHIADRRTETRHVSAGVSGLDKEATPVTDQNAPFKASFWDRARAKADRHIQPQRRPPSYAHVTRSQDKAVFTYCQNCGEDNQLTGQCKHRRKIECFHCGKFGHKIKFCSIYWSQGQKDWQSPISRASTFNLVLKDIGATNVYDINVLESIVISVTYRLIVILLNHRPMVIAFYILL